MKAAIEISFYPLNADYIPPIKAFIARLNTYPEFKVATSSMSTQVWGELDRLFAVLAKEIESVAIADKGRQVYVMKVIPGLAPS